MLALIAGRGDLPARVAASQAMPPVVCALKGTDPAGLTVDLAFRIETLGTLLSDLSDLGVTDVCFCGAIDRPAIDPERIDAATLPLVPQMMTALQAGDDGALRAVVKIFQSAGYKVRAAHELAPDLLASAGVLGQFEADAEMQADAARGFAILDALAPLDVGQACVVARGQVMGIETAGGTDFMLRGLPDGVAAARGVLVKGPKLGQDRRMDMPTIGPDTVAAVHAAGLAGIVVAAGETILLSPQETVAQADAAGIVLWARPLD